MQIGLDIGSTTIKIAVLDDAGNLLFHKYERHYSQIAEKILALHKELMTKFPTLHSARLAISGSGGVPAGSSRKAQTRMKMSIAISAMNSAAPITAP